MKNSIITQVPRKDFIQNIDLAVSESKCSENSALFVEDCVQQKISPRRTKFRNFLTSLVCCYGCKSKFLKPGKCQTEKFLLPPLRKCDATKKCLIIDLDETLVHSSFQPIPNADYVIPVEIDGTVHQVYVLKRPFVDQFLQRIGGLFECVLFTASLGKYAEPVADLLDKKRVFRARLLREACVFHKGNYVKDLARLGRDLSRVIILDNSPASYAFHPENALPVQSWYDDLNDTELLDILPLLEKLSQADDIYPLLGSCLHENSMLRSITVLCGNEAAEFDKECSEYENDHDDPLSVAIQELKLDYLKIDKLLV